MPGRFLLWVVSVVCAADARSRVMEPLIADLQRDWCDRPPGVSRLRSRLSGYCAFWIALSICAGRAAVQRDRDESAPQMRGAAAAYVMAAVAPVLLHLSGFGGRLNDETLRDALPAIGYGSAFALLPAMMRARTSGAIEWRRGATRLCAACALTAIVVIGWVQPALLNYSLAPRISPAQQPYYAALEPITRVAANAFSSSDSVIRATHRHFLEFEALMIVSGLAAGVFGWALAGVIRPTPMRVAIAWFVVTELVITRMYAVPPFWTQSWPLWLMASATLLLQIVAAQRKRFGAIP